MVDFSRTLLDIMKIELDVTANSSCAEITLQVICDNVKLAELQASEQNYTISHELPDILAEHCLKLVMSGKNKTHTKVNTLGEIIDDIYFKIDRLEFEDLDMREIFCLGYQGYTHNFNSSQPEFLDEFYGQLGCNGTVTLRFSTPIFLWLNDHLT